MQNKVHKLVTTLVLVLLGLASMPAASSAGTSFANVFGPSLHQMASTGSDPAQGEPDAPNIKTRLREVGPSDDTNTRGFTGMRVIRGHGRVWANWFLSLWIAR